ncbi:MAG: EAL domain-containing protein [Peptostreptococcaceae bacterium]|nr:EAL domain-containing protein [Peptostreptococcaceae bacterium]
MNLFKKRPNEWVRTLFRILLMIFLGVTINYIVYVTGGTKGAWTQLNFIVIVLAAYYWKVRGGLIIALLLGVLMGPLMPLDVAEGIMQTPGNWTIRLSLYLGIAATTGYVFWKNDEINKKIDEEHLISHFTGLYNANKLFLDLNKMIEKDEKFCLVFFNVVNLVEISKYIEYKNIEEMIYKSTTVIKSKFGVQEMYSNNHNEYILVLKEYDEDEITQIISSTLHDVLQSIEIEDHLLKLIVKAGIVFSDDTSNATEIFNEARIASDQGEAYESGVYVYDSDFASERKLFYEISGSLNNAIKNDELYLVYQPIISLKDNVISSIEVLARWDRGDRKPVGPDVFIKIAEKTGSIQRVTKEIMEQFANQLLCWEKEGMKIKASINCTAVEIADDAFREWVKKLVEEKSIDKADMGIEITERVFSRNEKKLNDVLAGLQAEGYCVSIDDFGTGYNTLKYLGQIKADVIKIDKYFIDRIDEKHIKSLVRHIIDAVHEMGLSVVAEGVETKEQLMILKELDCDKIQGYYFSKPLLADDFTDYYKSFNINKYI